MKDQPPIDLTDNNPDSLTNQGADIPPKNPASDPDQTDNADGSQDNGRQKENGSKHDGNNGQGQTNDNRGSTIDSQTIVHGETVNLNYSTASGEDQSPEFKDPTHTLKKTTKYDNHILDPNFSEETAKAVNWLEKERVIFIDCGFNDFQLAVAYRLAFHPRFDRYEKRSLVFPKSNKEEQNLTFDILDSDQIGETDHQIFIIELSSSESGLNFWSSMNEQLVNIDRMVAELEDKHRLVICTLSDKDIRGKFRQRLRQEDNSNSFPFPVWKIDSLRLLLYKEYGKGESKIVSYFYQTIHAQMANGEWGEPEDMLEFVSRTLSLGTLKFEEEVRSRTTGNEVRTQPSPKERAESLLSQKTAVRKPLLFTAAFFPDLPMAEFRSLASFLMQGGEVKIEKEVLKLTKKGKEKKKKIEERISAQKYWDTHTRTILAECKLNAIPNEEGIRTIDFTDPGLRSALKELFEQDDFFYLQNRFDKILGSNLLADPDSSKQLIGSITKLYSWIANEDPFHYGVEVLSNLILSALDTNIKIDPQGSDNQGLQAVPREVIQEIQAHFFRRLGTLIWEMVEYPRLRTQIRDFFNHLIQLKFHPIVLDIVNRVRYSENFDKMYWYQQLANRGDVTTQQAVFIGLINQAKQKSNYLYDFLDTIRAWLPTSDRNRSQYSGANHLSLGFFYGYARETIYRFPSKERGKWPTEYALFQFKEEEETEKLSIILSWLFDPRLRGQTYCLNQDVSSQFSLENTEGISDQPIVLSAEDVIEEWYRILVGLEPQHASPEALRLADRLLDQLIIQIKKVGEKDPKVRERKLYTSIIHHWKKKADLYHKIMRSSHDRNREWMMFLRSRRTLVLQLSQLFQQKISTTIKLTIMPEKQVFVAFDRVIKKVGPKDRPTKTNEELVIIDPTGKVVPKKPVFASAKNYHFYLVTKRNLIEAQGFSYRLKEADTQRKIEFEVSYEISCPEGSANIFAQSLASKDSPQKVFNTLWGDWTRAFFRKKKKEHIDVIDNFYQILPELKQYVRQQAKENCGVDLDIFYSPKGHETVKNYRVVTKEFGIRVKDFAQELTISFETDLEVIEGREMKAILKSDELPSVEAMFISATKKWFLKQVSLQDYQFDLHSTVRNQLIQALDSSLASFGRKIAYLHFTSATQLTPEESTVLEWEGNVRIKDYEKPIEVKSNLLVSLIDFGKFKNSNVGELENWANNELQKIIQRALFDQTYLDIIVKLDQLKEKIKGEMQASATRIGYDLQQLLVLPQIRALSLVDNFTIDIERDFVTLDSSVKLKLKTIVRGRIKSKDLARESLRNYLNPSVDLKRTIEGAIDRELEQAIYRIHPEQIYLHFRDDGYNGEVSVEESLKKKIVSVLKRFFVSDVSITISPEENEIVRRLKNLIGQFHSLQFDVAPFDHGGNGELIPATLEFKIAGDRSGWLVCVYE